MRSLGSVFSRLREVCELAAWLFRLLLRGARWQTVAAFALSLVGTATHVTAIGIFLSFVHAQTGDGILRAGPFELHARTTLTSLTLWSAAVLLMSLVTAATTYKSATLTYDAGRRAAQSFLRQALKIFTDSQLAHNELLSNPAGRALARQVFVSDSVVLIRTAVVGVSLFAPLLLFLLAISALLLLDPVLTAMIALPLALFSVPFWHQNRQIVAAARDLQPFVSERSAGLQGIFDYLSQTHVSDGDPAAMLDAALSHPASSGFEDALGHIMLRGHKVKFLKLVFLGVVLCGLLFGSGAFLAAEQRSWSALITYVVSLQYAVATMGTLAATITGVARFVPYLERMRALTTEGPPPRSSAARLAPVVRVATPRLPGSTAERRLMAGDVLVCAHPVQLDAFAVPAFLEKLTGSAGEAADLAGQTFFCGSPTLPPGFAPGSSTAGWQGPAISTDRRAQRYIEALDVPDGSDKRELDTDAGGRSAVLSYALLLMPGLVERRRVFILAWGPFRDLGPEGTKAILGLLHDRVTILVMPLLAEKSPYHADAVAVVDDRRVLGLGDQAWFAALDREHQLLAGFRSAAETARAKSVARPDDSLFD